VKFPEETAGSSADADGPGPLKFQIVGSGQRNDESR